MTTDTAFETYDEMIADPDWQRRLRALNEALWASMAGLPEAERCLNGNLFYAHKAPDFREAALLPRFDIKRRNLFALAQRIESFLEVGVNGGHSLFLALSANPRLKVVGIDVAERLHQSWAPVDLYVPEAFRWLDAAFPGRCTFIKGNSLVELPRFALDHPERRIDALHLDGSKETHLRETLAALPLMREGGFVIFDDANMAPVGRAMQQVKRLGIGRPADLSEAGIVPTPGHRIFEIADATG